MFKTLLTVALATVSLACSVEVTDRGYWIGADIECEHSYDAYLGQAFCKFFKNEKAQSIVDFGCGKGDYVKLLLENGFFAEGYDGNPDTPLFANDSCYVLDLSEPFYLGRKFDWVLSLEVGEHIPQEFETTFIENLHRHSVKGIVLSWAIVGQGGTGHVNTRNNDYIKNVMAKYGYLSDEEAERNLRQLASISWFKNTIMVFRKK